MAESITFQTIFQFLQTAGILVGVYYYIMTLRNARIMRQAQMLSSLRGTMDTPEFWMRYLHVVRESEGLTFEEMDNMVKETPELYGEFMSLVSFFQFVGWLVKNGIMDVKLIGENMNLAVIRVWEVVNPVIQWDSERRGVSHSYPNFEYLYEEMKKFSDS